MIDHENNENMWLEKVFNFYSQLKPENYKASSGMDPDHRLMFTGQMGYDGLEFVQFYIFCKDGGNKIWKDSVHVYNVYEDECSQKNRQRLSCDDFIELIRKFNLIKSKAYFENNMRLRWEQAKNRTIHMETCEKSTQLNRAIREPARSALAREGGRSASRRLKNNDYKETGLLTGKLTSGRKENDEANVSFVEETTNIQIRDIKDFNSLKNSSNREDDEDAEFSEHRDAVDASISPDTKKSKNIGAIMTSSKRHRRGKSDSFEKEFENSRTPFSSQSDFSKVKGQGNSRFSILSKVKNDPTEKTSPFTGQSP